jgi:choline dehydrogenase-like flavoprotein
MGDSQPENIHYDYIILGAGPAGIMSAYKLNQHDSSKKILIIDKGESLSTYKQTIAGESGANLANSFQWREASTTFGYAIDETTGRNLSLGKGYGGGTLHFGLQYIDNIIEKSDEYYQNWKNGDKNYFEEINNLLLPYQYDYEEQNSTLYQSAYIELKNKIDNTDDVDFYNNKIYSKKPAGLFQAERINVAELIENKANITKLVKTEVQKLNIDVNKIISCTANTETDTETATKTYTADNFCLCLGAIQTPILLLKSGIGPGKDIDLPVGQTLYDHAGLVTIYKKEESIQASQFDQDEVNRINALPEIPQGFEFKVFDIAENDNNYENLSSSDYNAAGIKMHAIFQHTKLSNDQLVKAIKGEYPDGNPNGNITLGTGVYYVYDMGDYWNGGGNGDRHGGGSQFLKLAMNDYNLTDVLLRKHSSQHSTTNPIYKRLFPGEQLNRPNLNPKNSKLVGIYKDSFVVSATYQDLNFKDTEILQHVQTRDSNLNWQTYYSIIPSESDKLILTHSHSAKINNKGLITLNENNEAEITLNHFQGVGQDEQGYTQDQLKNYIKSSFDSNHALLTELGYKLDSIFEPLLVPNAFNSFLDGAYQSIYHYHGSCPEGTVVDSNHKVKQTKNLYIGDISVLNKPWGGSTSVPALITGYKTAENMINDNKPLYHLYNGWNLIGVEKDKDKMQLKLTSGQTETQTETQAEISFVTAYYYDSENKNYINLPVNNNNIDYSTETSFKTSNSALWIKVNLPNDYSPQWVEYEFVNNTSNIETVLKENTRKKQPYRTFRFTHN